jgi:hypothetical protein
MPGRPDSPPPYIAVGPATAYRGATRKMGEIRPLARGNAPASPRRTAADRPSSGAPQAAALPENRGSGMRTKQEHPG